MKKVVRRTLAAFLGICFVSLSAPSCLAAVNDNPSFVIESTTPEIEDGSYKCTLEITISNHGLADIDVGDSGIRSGLDFDDELGDVTIGTITGEQNEYSVYYGEDPWGYEGPINHYREDGTWPTVWTDDPITLHVPISFNSTVKAGTYTVKLTKQSVYGADGEGYGWIDGGGTVIWKDIEQPQGTITIGSDATGDEGETADYSAYLSSTDTEVTSTGTFTADVYMKSDQALACGQIDLTCENGKVTDIKIADGIENGSNENGKISFYNNEASAKEGLKIATVTVTADGSGEDVVLKISESVASISRELLDQSVTLGEDATLTMPVSKTDQVSCTAYAAEKYLILYKGNVDDGNVAMYGNNVMNYSDRYNAWAVLADEDVSDSLKNSSVTVQTGEKNSISYNGDVNGNEKTNIVDAQIAYDLSTAVYNDFSKATRSMWMEADVNGDMSVTSADAQAIQSYIHTGKWE